MSDTGYSNFQPGQTPLVGPGGYGLPFAQQGPLANPNEYLEAQNRPSSQWGQPDLHLDRANNYPGVDPSPYMPKPGMFNNIMMNARNIPWSMQGTQNAGRSVYWLAGYYRALRQGKMDSARLAAENFELSSKKWMFDQAKELQDAHDLIGGFQNLPGKHDRSDPAFSQAVNNYFAEHHDPEAQRIWENSKSPYTDLATLFNGRDTYWLTANKALSQRGKATEGTTLDDIPGGAGGASTEAPSTTPDTTASAAPDTTAPTPAATPTTPAGPQPQPEKLPAPQLSQGQNPTQSPADEAARTGPVQAPSNAPETAPATSDGSSPVPTAGSEGAPTAARPTDAVSSDTDLSGVPYGNGQYPRTMNAARERLNGGTAQGLGKAAGSVISASDALKMKLQKAAEKQYSSPQAAFNAFRAIDGQMADRARQIAYYDRDLPSSGFGNRLYEMSGLLQNMATKIRPDYDPQNFKTVQDYQKATSSTGPYQQMLGTAAMNTALQGVYQSLTDLEKKNPNATVPENFVNRVIGNTFGNEPGDEQWRGAANQIRGFAQEAARATVGVFRVNVFQEIMHTMDETKTPSQLRAAIRAEVQTLHGRYNEFNDDYRRLRGKDAPAYNRNTNAMFEAVIASDPYSATTTKPVPPMLKGYLFQRPAGVSRDKISPMQKDGFRYYRDKNGAWQKIQ